MTVFFCFASNNGLGLGQNINRHSIIQPLPEYQANSKGLVESSNDIYIRWHFTSRSHPRSPLDLQLFFSFLTRLNPNIQTHCNPAHLHLSTFHEALEPCKLRCRFGASRHIHEPKLTTLHFIFPFDQSSQTRQQIMT